MRGGGQGAHVVDIDDVVVHDVGEVVVVAGEAEPGQQLQELRTHGK